jgi:predicted DsbA family dithiol-disulfide isomerase
MNRRILQRSCARAHGKLAPMHSTLLRRYLTEAQDFYDMATLRAAAKESGLDPDELEHALEAAVLRMAVERAGS